MRIPPKSVDLRWLQGLGLVIAGMVIGSAVFMSLTNQTYRDMVMERDLLIERNASLSKEIDRLQKNDNDESVIHNVKIRFVKKDDKKLDYLTRQTLVKLIEQDLSVFIGQPKTDLPEDFEEASALMKNKVYPSIGDTDYQIELKSAVVLGPDAYIWAAVKPYIKQPAIRTH